MWDFLALIETNSWDYYSWYQSPRMDFGKNSKKRVMMFINLL
jgi:hypothetical protein